MKKIVAFLCISLWALHAEAQKFTILEGDFSFIKNVKSVDVKFRYDDLKLMKENKSEAEYIAERKDDLNKKSAGSGDAWVKKWEGAKSSIWEANFLELMAKTITDKKGVVFGENLKDAPVSLTVDAVWIYPGWDAGVMKQPAKVSTILTFKDQNKVVLKIQSDNAPGDQWGSNFSNESRIGEGFEKTAKTLGNRLIKDGFK